jgi:hypothetical protein
VIASNGVTFVGGATEMEITATQAVWEDDVEFVLSQAQSYINLRVIIESEGVDAPAVIGPCPRRFAITLSPQAGQRDTNIGVSISRLNPDGTRNTTYVPTAPLAMQLLEKDDPADTLTVTTVPITGWSSGSRTVTIQITGGTATEAAYTLHLLDGEDLGDGLAYGVLASVLTTIPYVNVVQTSSVQYSTSFNMFYMDYGNSIPRSYYNEYLNSLINELNAKWTTYLEAGTLATYAPRSLRYRSHVTIAWKDGGYRAVLRTEVGLNLHHTCWSKVFAPGTLPSKIVATIAAGCTNDSGYWAYMPVLAVASNTPIVSGSAFYSTPGVIASFTTVQRGTGVTLRVDITTLVESLINRSAGGTLYIAIGIGVPTYTLPQNINLGSPPLTWVPNLAYSYKAIEYVPATLSMSLSGG